MKKIFNCKPLLALMICLSLFTGLAATASAYPYLPSCQYCGKTMGHVGKAYVYCSYCFKSQSVDKFVCKDSQSTPQCKGVKYYCPYHGGYFNG